MLKSILSWLKYQLLYALTMPYVTTQMQKDNISIFVKKIVLVAICLRYLMSLIGPDLSVTHYFKGEESNEKYPFGRTIYYI